MASQLCPSFSFNLFSLCSKCPFTSLQWNQMCDTPPPPAPSSFSYITMIRFTFPTKRHEMRAPALKGVFYGRGAEYGITPVPRTCLYMAGNSSRKTSCYTSSQVHPTSNSHLIYWDATYKFFPPFSLIQFPHISLTCLFFVFQHITIPEETNTSHCVTFDIGSYLNTCMLF